VADDEGWEARMAARHGGWSEIEIHTEEGRETRAAVLVLVSANLNLYVSEVAARVAEATANYQANTCSLVDRMRASGLTEAQIDELIGKYREVERG
jgi:hypothetical protein